MALTPEEEAELAQLEAELASPQAPAAVEEPSYMERFADTALDGDTWISALESVPGQLFEGGKAVVSGIGETIKRAPDAIMQDAAAGVPFPQFSGPVRAAWDVYSEGKTPAQQLGGIIRPAAQVASGPFFPVTGKLIDKAFQAVAPEDFPATTPEQDAQALATETATVGAPAAVIKGVGMAGRGIANRLNDPQRMANMLGATPTEMKGFRKTPIQQNIEWLDQNSPAYQQGVAAQSDIRTMFNNANARLNQIGAEIQGLYGRNSTIRGDFNDVLNHPAYIDIVSRATDPATAPAVANQLMGALGELNAPLQAISRTGPPTLEQLWTLRRSLDELATFNKPELAIADEALGSLRNAVRDAIDQAVTRSGTGDAATLNALNAEYHNLAPVTKAIDNGVAKWGGKFPVLDDRTPMNLAGTIGKLSGLGTHTFRAGMRSAAPVFDLINAAGLGAGLALGETQTQLLPRSFDLSQRSPAAQNVIGSLAANYGLLMSKEEYQKLPYQHRKAVFTQLANLVPEAFAPTPEGYRSVVDNKFTDIMERDAHLQAALDKDLPTKERAEMVGGLLEKNTYVPFNSPVTAPIPTPTPAPRMSLSNFNSSLDIPMTQTSPGNFEHDSVRLLSQLTKSQGERDSDRSGY